MGPIKPKTPKKKNLAKRTPYQVHGGALFDHMSKSALNSLKVKLGLNTEENYVDATIGATLTTTLTNKITFPTIPQGNGVGQRVGSSIRITGFEFRIHLAAGSTQSNGATARWLIVRNVGAGGPAASDFLANISDISSPYVHTYKQREITIIDDFVLDVGTPLSGNSTAFVSKRYNNPNWHCQWPDTDTAGAVGSLLEGAIGIYGIVNAVSTISPTVTGYVRFYYVDN